jgi:hypothetical protein
VLISAPKLGPKLLHGSNGQFLTALCPRLQLLINSLPCFTTLFQGYLPVHWHQEIFVLLTEIEKLKARICCEIKNKSQA